MNILVTGASGFVGKNLLSSFKGTDIVTTYNWQEVLKVNADAVIHLAGKAHDLKRVAAPEAYYEVNATLTKKIFDAFAQSKARVFIFMSSVKAVADKVDEQLTEDAIPNPTTHYGKSKLEAEQYIMNQVIPLDKRVYILRPCMIHGPHNKGNLNLLYTIVSKGVPWPLGSFHNKRSYCSIDNLCYIINELIRRTDVPSGVYQVADDEPLSTNDVIKLIGQSKNKQPVIINLPKGLIMGLAKIGDMLRLPFNRERLEKLTENYVVSNVKIKTALGKPLPVLVKEGLLKTFGSFK